MLKHLLKQYQSSCGYKQCLLFETLVFIYIIHGFKLYSVSFILNTFMSSGFDFKCIGRRAMLKSGFCQEILLLFV